jgi:PAS domain S-box-containing protein
MSVDELTYTETGTETGRITKDACTASALQAPPDFIEKLPVAIYGCDMQGRIVWFNARAVAMWGRTPRRDDDVESFCETYSFEGRQIAPEQTPVFAVLKTGIPIHGVEGLVERPDGSRIWTMAHIEPIKDENGKVVGAINCFHETTELHLATEALEDLFENGIVALHLVSGDGTILRVNAKELQMLGYAPDEYVGRNISEFHVDQATVADMLERLSRNEQLVQYPARLRAKDGSIRHALVSSSARFRDGQFVNTRCFTVDLTERLRAEERMRRQEEQHLAATYQYAPTGSPKWMPMGGCYAPMRKRVGCWAIHRTGRWAARFLSQPSIKAGRLIVSGFSGWLLGSPTVIPSKSPSTEKTEAMCGPQ